jgi:hypothetical protein
MTQVKVMVRQFAHERLTGCPNGSRRRCQLALLIIDRVADAVRNPHDGNVSIQPTEIHGNRKPKKRSLRKDHTRIIAITPAD